ncbi:hypothetical protein ACE1CI_12705, partial [Aerosakkonemataceae cyanobacterium BLCC-F50]
MPEPNGGSAEYSNIISNLDGIGDLLENELLNKKFVESDLTNPMENMNASVAPILGTFATSAIITMPMPNNPLNQIALEAANSLDDAFKALQGGANAFKGAASGMINGGIRSLLNFGKAVLPLVGQIVAVLVAFGVVAFEIWYTFDQIGQSVSYLYEAKAELEVKIGSLQAENRALKSGLATLERTTKQQLQQQAVKIQTLEVTVANLETLIKSNHTETISKINSAVSTLGSIQTKQSEMDIFARTKWEINEEWQFNNRAAAVATLTTAAVEAPGRPLDLIKTSVTTTQAKLQVATEGVPSNATGDADYTAAIAGGTAVAAGTIGYATWKGMNGGFKDVKKKLGSMINISEIMQALTLITTIHNALNLSRDIGTTLFSVVDNSMNLILKSMGVTDADGEEISTSKSVREFLDNTMKTVFGVQLWTEIKADWAAANRIVSAGNTLLWSVRELGDNVGSLATLACENTGKIGNSLRKAGVIFNGGPWFPENYSRGNTWGIRMTNF